MNDLTPVIDRIDADQSARYVFLVTHGPFTTNEAERSFRWRLGGRPPCEASRRRLYETLSRRRAIILSGHTHTTDFFRHENRFGGFAEFTANSVWSKAELATAEPQADRVEGYGSMGLDRHEGEKLEDFKREIAFFKPGLKAYFHNAAAGHYRLNVSGSGVTMAFYPGAASEPARTFRLA